MVKPKSKWSPASKHSKWLNTQQKEIFIAKGFTNALLNAVISDGWDKRDIDDYIIKYNHNNNEKIPIPKLTNGMLQEIERRKKGQFESCGESKHRDYTRDKRWNPGWHTEEYPFSWSSEETP